MSPRQIASYLFVIFILCSAGPGSEAVAQQIRVDGGGGWGLPISTIEMDVNDQTGAMDVNLDSGAHMYGAVGFVQSVSEHLGLGARLRAQMTRVPGSSSDLTPLDPSCGNYNCSVSGQHRAATVEGRLFLQTIDWIEPYFLVGLGVVQTDVEVTDTGTSDQVQEAQVMDAGGDVGLGASLPIVGGIALETEIRVTGSLPGGRDSSLSLLPMSAGLSVGF